MRHEIRTVLSPRHTTLAKLCGLGLLSLFFGACGPHFEGHATVATLEVVRTPVEIRGTVLGHAVAGDERLGSGEKLQVADKAQAILRHDQGARLLLDSGTRAELSDTGLALSAGRLWVDA